MTAAELKSSALNLRARAENEPDKDRAGAWIKEAAELEAQATSLAKAKTAK